MLDGFTVTAADTPENQNEYPQNPLQKAGLGCPILRCVSLVPMMTGLLPDVIVTEREFGPDRFTVTATILDRANYPAKWIRSIYQSRWLVELDIRSIKCSLGMDILCAKSPSMVRTVLWSCLPAYNLIRMKMLQSGSVLDRDVRSISSTTTMQLLAANWTLYAVIRVDKRIGDWAINGSDKETVRHCLGRVDPRKNERCPKLIGLLTKPRHLYHTDAELAA